MEIRFSHSLFGYDPAAVNEKIRIINEDFRNNYRQLQREAAHLHGEIDLQKANIKELEQELAVHKSLINEIKEILLSSHLKACENVCQAEQKAGAMRQEVLESIAAKEKEVEQLKKTHAKINQEIQAIAKEYIKALEAFTNG